MTAIPTKTATTVIHPTTTAALKPPHPSQQQKCSKTYSQTTNNQPLRTNTSLTKIRLRCRF
eukprot:2503789-Ditylum_brightwellii.AAC.1